MARRSRRLRDPNSRLQGLSKMEPKRAVREIRDVLVDIWYIINPFSSSQDGDYTTTGAVAIERVIMTNTVSRTVLLHPFPSDLDEVIVKRTDAQVTLDGNGKTIDGSATKILGTQYDGAHLIYTDAAAGWSFI